MGFYGLLYRQMHPIEGGFSGADLQFHLELYTM